MSVGGGWPTPTRLDPGQDAGEDPIGEDPATGQGEAQVPSLRQQASHLAGDHGEKGAGIGVQLAAHQADETVAVGLSSGPGPGEGGALEQSEPAPSQELASALPEPTLEPAHHLVGVRRRAVKPGRGAGIVEGGIASGKRGG